MNASLTAISEQVEALSPEDRRELLAYLQAEAEETEDALIARERMAQLQSGAVQAVPVEQVWAKLEALEQRGALSD